MERSRSKNQQGSDDELLVSCCFDYKNAKPNRFTSRGQMQRCVLLDEDLAKVFTNLEAVKVISRNKITCCSAGILPA
jgi:hypothetical protein